MSAKEPIRFMLTGGDRRSIGRADEVVTRVRQYPEDIKHLIPCLWDEDLCVCMRAADAMEKISREQAPLLQPYKAQLLGLLAEATQKEVRWHLALTIPRLRLTVLECQRVANRLQAYLGDHSSIVKTFAMQGLFDLTRQNAALMPIVMELLRLLTRTGTPAMRARGRILLEKLEPPA